MGTQLVRITSTRFGHFFGRRAPAIAFRQMRGFAHEHSHVKVLTRAQFWVGVGLRELTARFVLFVFREQRVAF